MMIAASAASPRKAERSGSDQQDQHQRIQEKAQKVDNGRMVLGRGGIIGAKLAEPCLGFLGGQSVGRR